MKEWGWKGNDFVDLLLQVKSDNNNVTGNSVAEPGRL